MWDSLKPEAYLLLYEADCRSPYNGLITVIIVIIIVITNIIITHWLASENHYFEGTVHTTVRAKI